MKSFLRLGEQPKNSGLRFSSSSSQAGLKRKETEHFLCRILHIHGNKIMN